jgi:alkanesulfonate monooxygenase SsuD/methylene tetrahydromethanopterin reductase-like flavin-dependent oxidoreductase (luciferase family)
VERGRVARVRLRGPSTTERFERLEDALQICRGMFRHERTTFHGFRHSVDGAINVPQPVQPGGPRILIGGMGERKTLRLVAQYADMWNGFGDPSTVRHKLDVLDEHCRDIGRDRSEIETTRLGTQITDPTIVVTSRAFLEAGLDGMIYGRPTGTTPDQVAEAAREVTAAFA